MISQYENLPPEFILNYIGKVSIRESDGKGRGVFADEDIKQGELIMIDRAISTVERGQDYYRHLDFNEQNTLINNVSTIDKAHID